MVFGLYVGKKCYFYLNCRWFGDRIVYRLLMFFLMVRMWWIVVNDLIVYLELYVEFLVFFIIKVGICDEYVVGVVYGIDCVYFFRMYLDFVLFCCL